MSIWVLVADTSRARVFSADKPAGPLEEILDLTHPEARLHDAQLASDEPGRDRNSSSGSHSYAEETPPKRDAAAKFASQVCDALEEGRVAGKISKLYVIAPPTFLGLLRKCQSNGLRSLIAEEVSKNISTRDVETIRTQLPKYM
jgi:protein required for attachment to host cells